MTHRKILVIGSANIDLVARVSRIPRPGETLMGRSFDTICGGKGANQAVAAARLGGHVFFLGCVGDDAFGAQQKESLGSAGVNLDYLKTIKGTPTGTAIIEVSDEGENSIVVVPGANFELTPEDIYACRSVFESVDAVLLQLEVPVPVVAAALDLAGETNTLSILDIGSDQPVSEAVIGKATLVTPNASEAERLTGIKIETDDDVEAAARRLQSFGSRHVVMKLGSRGSRYFGVGGRVDGPPFAVDVVDTTAAGDAFTGALGVGWDEGNIAETLRYANAVGALATTRAGAQPSLPFAADVLRLREEQG